MPKITVHGGASHKAALPEPSQGEVETECPGNNSSASTESKPKRSEPIETTPRKPARTTGNRSGKGRTGRSSARSTGTTGQSDA